MPYVAKPKPCYMDQFEFYKVIDSINYHDYINMSSGDKIAARSYNLEEVKKYKKDGE